MMTMAYTFTVEGEDVHAIHEVIDRHTKAYLVPSYHYQLGRRALGRLVARNRLSYEIELPYKEMVKFKKALRRLGRGKVRFSINELRTDVMVVR